jgi:hypothetical protein
MSDLHVEITDDDKSDDDGFDIRRNIEDIDLMDEP